MKPNLNIEFNARLASEEKSNDTHKTLNDCRGHKRMKASEQINEGATIPAAELTVDIQVDHANEVELLTYYSMGLPTRGVRRQTAGAGGVVNGGHVDAKLWTMLSKGGLILLPLYPYLMQVGDQRSNDLLASNLRH
ncbi:hypothetical protein EVAR_846_1 [Eumeta japonica]|uniref:Uncharacterized protein n=1 Tax=Eumeta variegata TaxID=151549 RepID=A0A4C1SDP6_EUMVA|nr:hypothetical protein EVAR_846_1 [Eumeta japonica]